MGDRPLRFCDVCGGLDDHPRHGIAVPAGTPAAKPSNEFLASLPPGAPVEAVARLLNERWLERHLDCCAAQGCEVCQATERATAGVRGQALTDAIAAGALDAVDTTGLGLPPETRGG